MKHLFYGGVHPADKKALSSGFALKKIEEPKQVIIPMSQHIGAPATPLVAVGDVVKKGQKIGSIGFYSGDTLLYETDLITENAVEKISFKSSFDVFLHNLYK